MVWETGFQTQVKSQKTFLKMVLDISLLKNQLYQLQFKGSWSNLGKGVAPFHTT